MNPDVPYMVSVTNLHKILDAIQKAGAPEVFHLDFLKEQKELVRKTCINSDEEEG